MVVALEVGEELFPLVAGSLITLVVFVVLLILCVCGKSNGGPEKSQESYRKTEEGKAEELVLTIDKSVVPLNGEQQNGNLRNSGGSTGSGSSPHPPNAGFRELPQPPTNGIPANRNTIAGHGLNTRNGNPTHRNTIAGIPSPEDDDDDYDHLVRNNHSVRKSNYDHVTFGENGVPKIEARVESSTSPIADNEMLENDYAEVQKENIYEGVKDDVKVDLDDDYNKVKDEIPKHLRKPYDPYAMVSDEGSDGTFKDTDPYTSVNDTVKDDPYAKVKGASKDFDLYAKVKEDPYSKLPDDIDDPYNKVEDPYNKVKDEDPYNKVKGDDSFIAEKGDDPYSKVKGDDPYNRVKDDDDIDDPYNKVKDEDSAGTWPPQGASYEYSKVDKNYKNEDSEATMQGQMSIRNSGDFNIQSFSGEYAQVVKNKNRNEEPTPPNLNNRQNEHDPYTLPPEPPRRYNDPVVNAAEMATVDLSSNIAPHTGPVILNGTASPSLPTADFSASGIGPSGKKEPPYHKLTARESMASINARRAMNTYEEVPDTENMYATVDGGSGDGVVRKTEQHTAVNTVIDDYAEIGATAVVPTPPSLDSLHLMTKTDGKQRLSAEIDMVPESGQKSPVSSPTQRSSGINDIQDMNGSFGLVNPAFDGPDVDQDDIILDPNYTTVRDCIPDSEGDIDPNYESVEEAKAKSSAQSRLEKEREMIMERKKRAHVYEVVKTEAEEVKDRVLRSHMYEDLEGVKFEKDKLDSDNKNGKENNSASSKRLSDIWKRRSDVEDEKL